MGDKKTQTSCLLRLRSSSRHRTHPGGSLMVEHPERFERAVECLKDHPEDESCLDHLNQIGRGSNRFTVEADDDLIVKIDTTPSSEHRRTKRSSNEREIRVWKKMDDSLREEIVPIEDHGDHWLSMPRVSPWDQMIKDDEIDERVPLEEMDRIERKFESRGFRCTDIRSINFGLDEGEWKLFDYADCYPQW